MSAHRAVPRWTQRSAALVFTLALVGTLAVTITAVATGDATSAALGGFTTALLVGRTARSNRAARR